MNAKDLDTGLTTLNGAKIMLAADKELTYRSALVSACETYQGEAGDGSMLKAYNIGFKIINVKEEFRLEQDEVELLKRIVETNKAFMAVVVGRLLDFVNKLK